MRLEQTSSEKHARYSRKSVQKTATKKPSPPARPGQASTRETDRCQLPIAPKMDVRRAPRAGRERHPGGHVADVPRPAAGPLLPLGLSPPRPAEVDLRGAVGGIGRAVAATAGPAPGRPQSGGGFAGFARRPAARVATQKAAWQAELAGHGLLAKGFEVGTRPQYRNRTYRANGTNGTH